MNLQYFRAELSGYFKIAYEPVLVSTEIDMPIFGVSTESKFRRIDIQTLTYTPTNSDEKIILKYFMEEVEGNSAAYVKVSKTIVVRGESSNVVKGKVSCGKWLKENTPPHLMFINSKMKIEFPEVIMDSGNVEFTIDNNSKTELRLKKGDYLGEVAKLTENVSQGSVKVSAFEERSVLNCGKISEGEVRSY